ncbi:Fusaric acid resistance protein-like-domain-containing protein [Parasitella parasitica]|nr:Fusaric acid resistance protein-like-domain-containing protein [Parasitella parasitica]
MNENPKRRRPENADHSSDPVLSSLSTSPESYFTEGAYSRQTLTHQPNPELERSSPGISEIDVILDDGTIQKRAVSLSTLSDEESQQHDTTPLLKSRKVAYQNYEHYQGYASSSCGDSSTSDDDSDEPFFPVQTTSSKRRSHHVIEDDENSAGFARQTYSTIRSLWAACKFTPRQRLVLKCSFAYFLGSLFTFVPALNALIGNNHVSSHLVATATVFFNPAKSLGGMVEAAAYGWGYVFFAVCVCLGSMVTADFFVDRDHYLVAHSISLFFWLSGATFIVSFLKAHWNKPPVSSASSLCFITIFIIIVREGSFNRGDFDTTRIQQITTAVATGTLITVACCVIFWPISAAKKLKKDLDATLASYRILLKLLTKTFLLDDDLPEFRANRILQTAIESHQASFTALQKSLKEARLETVWNSEVRGRGPEYDAVIKSMQRLAQHMGGLRSSCGIQFEVMGSEATKKYKEMSRKRKKEKAKQKGPSIKKSQSLAPEAVNDTNWNVRAGYRRRKLQDEIRKHRSSLSRSDDQFNDYQQNNKPSTSFSETASFNDTTPLETTKDDSASLINFIQTIRPPLKSFAFTCKRTLFHLQTSFSTSNSTLKWLPRMGCRRNPSFAVLKANLKKAIILFETAQKQAIQTLYQSRVDYIASSTPENANVESEAIGCVLGEEVILVYFYVFNMIEFARELITLVDAVEKLNEAGKRKVGVWASIKNSWNARKDRSSIKDIGKQQHYHHLYITPFVPNQRNTFNTLHTPEPKTKWRRFFIRLWQAFSLFKSQKIRYAIKSTVATIILALPAFLEPSKDFFRTYRMEWALITLMVVMTPTVGGTNLVAIYRVFSTVLGCYVAMAFYMMFPGNAYVLPILTWMFSIPNFYLILNHKHGKFGQFTLLAYNLVMLNKYNDRDTNEVEVWVLANRRCFAILVGVVLGLVVTAYIWPYEARVELRKGLSDFLLRLAWLYQKLVSIYADYPLKNRGIGFQHQHQQYPINFMEVGPDASETQVLTFEAQRRIATQSFMDLELGLQRALLDLQALLSQTPNEPRLKGSFPLDTYRTMLTSCQNIVDRFVSMRTVMLRDAWYDEIQHNFMTTVAHERKEMVGNVLLYFYLLASALRLKTPMPPYFPPARKAWKSLLDQLCEMPIAKSKKLLEQDNVYVFYYAYVTLMEDIIRELDKVIIFINAIDSMTYQH